MVNSVTHDINVYDIIESTIIYTFKYHKESVVGIIYHTKCDYIISLDKNGVFNYWKPRDGSIPKQDLKYKFQVATDLYLFKKNQVVPLSLSMSKGCKWMGVFANDWKVHHTSGVSNSSTFWIFRQANFNNRLMNQKRCIKH